MFLPASCKNKNLEGTYGKVNKVEGTVRRNEVEGVRCTMNRTMTNTFFYICNLHFFK